MISQKVWPCRKKQQFEFYKDKEWILFTLENYQKIVVILGFSPKFVDKVFFARGATDTFYCGNLATRFKEKLNTFVLNVKEC